MNKMGSTLLRVFYFLLASIGLVLHWFSSELRLFSAYAILIFLFLSLISLAIANYSDDFLIKSTVKDEDKAMINAIYSRKGTKYVVLLVYGRIDSTTGRQVKTVLFREYETTHFMCHGRDYDYFVANFELES